MKRRSSLFETALTICFSALVASLPAANADPVKSGQEVLSSPDGRISLTFGLTDGTPSYVVNFTNKPAILSSTLGFDFKGSSMKSNFVLLGTKRLAHDETWTQPWGERQVVHNHYNELLVTLQQSGDLGRELLIRFRAFDDAIAFRYEWPEQPGLKDFEIMNELTDFVLPSDPMILWQPAFRPQASEQLYARTRLSELLRQTRLEHGDAVAGDNPNRDPVRAVTTPLTMQTDDGLFLVIHEADLTDYAAMELQPRDNNTLKCDLAPWSDGSRVKASAPSVSPWRYVMISDHLSDIVERTSDISLNLNPPSEIADTSWIKPGKFVGIWWGMHLGKYTWNPSKPGEQSTDGLGATTENARRYIDFAAKYGFSAVLVEGWNKGWARDWVAHAAAFSFTESNPQFDLPGLTKYAHERGVDLISHHETGAVITNYEAQVEAAFAQCERLGIHHVKTGYVGMEPRVNRYDEDGKFIGAEYLDGQYMVRHYRKVAILAAKYHIMLDAHEPIKDTGEQRTWPNFMSREGARGQEYNAWSPDGGNPPDHDVNLVFTRFLSGPFDFTPGVIQVTYPEYKKNNRVHTTAVKQLAMYVCFYSSLQMAADLPENYEKYRDLFQFIIDVPADWEETHMLNGEVGEYVTIARKQRGGSDWFIGSMTNEKGRDYTIPLTFLDQSKTYVAEIYRDGDDADWKTNPIAYKIENRPVTCDSVLSLHLAPGGGEAIRLKPAKPEEAVARRSMN
ncbi:MAG: glycoside hydrolase family 97 protein [Verrucomicrobiota bacterium]|jgi:alpha-glucosidase